jgi:hypothetical protein
VLGAVVDAGEPASPDLLLPVVGGSWHRLADSLSVLAGRGLVRIRPGFVLATQDGRAAVGGSGVG